MAGAGASCAFCSASAQLVDACVLDEKWSRLFGGEPVVALDHGWYTSAQGERVAADHQSATKFFRPYQRAVCDYCTHGWMEDVRWRAEPALLDLARGRSPDAAGGIDRRALVRWAQLTALLAELLEEMPTAASIAQRSAVRHAAEASPGIDTWLFTMRQRLPARIHLSQVGVPHRDGADGLLQVVSIDVAQFSALVVVPSDDRARQVVDRAQLDADFGPLDVGRQVDGAAPVQQVDLAHARHPQRIAVQRLCAASGHDQHAV